jgi:hypothetical protein
MKRRTTLMLAGVTLLGVATLARAGLAQSREVIANHKIKGQVTLEVDDGTAVKNNTPLMKPVSTSDQRLLAPSLGSGSVFDWNSVRARASAIQAAGAARAAKVTAKSEETSTFSLERKGRKVDMKVVLHRLATMEDRGAPGVATIDVHADITGAGTCALSGMFTLTPQAAPARTINVAGAKNFTMVNGGGSSDQVITAPQCILNAGNYTLAWSANVTSDNKMARAGAPGVQVNVDKAVLSLTK